MTITTEIKEELRNVYRPLERAYELKGTVFCSEFDKANTLADKRLNALCHDMSESAFGLWKLGLLPEEELNDIRKCADKLHDFVVFSIEYFRNAENHGFINYSEADFIELFGIYFNMVK